MAPCLSGIGFEWNFSGFAVPALLIALVPRLRGNRPHVPAPHGSAESTTKEEATA